MQTRPGEARKVMADPAMRAKIEKLVAAGVLRMG